MKRARHVRRVLMAAGVATLLAASVVVASGTTVAGAAGSNKVTITSGEYTYKLSGKLKPGNVEIEFDNPGVEIHMVAIIQLKSGVTKKQLSEALLSDDDSAVEKLVAGKGFNIGGTPGLLSQGETTTNISKLGAGHYGLLCFVPDPEGVPHIAHGMVATFDVKGSKSSLTPPSDGVSEVSITDAAITIPSSGVPKSGWLKVTNDGSAPRDLTIAGYTSDETFEAADAEVDAFFETGTFPSGTAPVVLLGGAATLAPGETAYVQSTIPAGRAVLVSSDADGENDIHLDVNVS